MVGNHNSDVQLRNMAAEDGGDTLLMTKNEEGLFGSERAAFVYRCHAAPP